MDFIYNDAISSTAIQVGILEDTSPCISEGPCTVEDRGPCTAEDTGLWF